MYMSKLYFKIRMCNDYLRFLISLLGGSIDNNGNGNDDFLSSSSLFIHPAKGMHSKDQSFLPVFLIAVVFLK